MNKKKKKHLDAIKFLKPSRIDLVPKLCYVKNKEERINEDFFTEMYLEHIKAFNHFNENHKRNRKDFLEDFNKLIESIKKEGFKEEKGAIPSTEDFTAIDGAHRLASSIYFQKKVPVKIFKGKDIGPNYNYKYFKKRGLNERILEEIVFQYFLLKRENIHVGIFWGSALGKLNEKEIEKELKRDKIEVVYSKRLKLTERGKKNLVITCYENEPWMSDKGKNFSGAIRKVAPCFKGSNNVMFYLLESKDKEKIVRFKKKIRERLKIGNHSIHSSDTQEEVRNLCSLLLNRNSFFYLNHGEKMVLPEVLEKKEVKNRDDFVIVSTYPMELFGLKKAGDIDYVILNGSEISGLHNHNSKFNKREITELIYNPENFFRFRGIKFLTLEKIMEFKKKGEKKDRRDVLLIEKFLHNNKKFDAKEKIFIIQMKVVSVALRVIKMLPQSTRNKLKECKPLMFIYKKAFC